MGAVARRKGRANIKQIKGNTMSKTYRFKSGYEIAARDDYNPRLFNLAAEAWRESNPAPEPPIKIKQVRVKGGFKDIENKDWNDSAFLAAHDAWTQAGNNATAMMLMSMAVDVDSLDTTVLEAAQQWADDNGIEIPSDPVRAFIQVVAGEGEITEFFQWLNSLEGPKSALVDQFIKIFRSEGPVQGTNGVDMGHTNPRRTVPRMAGSPQADDGTSG